MPLTRLSTSASRILALGALWSAGLAAPASAQVQAPPEPVEPVVPGAPTVVVSGHPARLTPASTARIEIGCLGRPDELCKGTVTLRLAEPVLLPQPDLPARNGQPAKPRPPRRIAPFALGSAQFGVVHTRANAYRIRVPRVLRAILRVVGRVPVSVTVTYSGTSGVTATATRRILVYIARRDPATTSGSRAR